MKTFLFAAISLFFLHFSYGQTTYAVVDDGADALCSGAWPAEILGNYAENGTSNGKPCYQGPNNYWLYYVYMPIIGSNCWVVGYPLGESDINAANVRFYISSSASTPPLNVRYSKSPNGCGYMKVNSGTAAPPAAPTLSSPSNVGTTSMDLYWSQSTGATGYHVYVSTNSSFTALISGLDPKDVPKTASDAYAPNNTSISGLTIGTLYYIMVRSYSGAGESTNSNTVSVTTIPGSPTATSATSITDQTAQANWNATSGVTGYKLYVSTNSGFTSYVSGYNGLGTDDQTFYDISGLSANTLYYYRLKAYNSAGESGYSNTISFTTAAGAPVATAATSLSEASFSANWNSSTGATSYLLDVSTNSSFSTYVTGYNNKNVGNVTTYPVTGLSSGSTYYYQVRSTNSNGTSSNSNSISVETIPGQPTATNASDIIQTSFSANWNSVPGTTGYYLDVASDAGFTNMVSGYNNLDVGNVLTYAINTNLSPNTGYYYRVRAYNGSGTGANSNVINLTTEKDTPHTQASSITFSSISMNSMTISWTNGDGANRIAFVKEGSGAITDPTDGSSYTASNDWASKGSELGSSGYYCIYNGSGNLVTLTGLIPGTQYTVRIYEYNSSGVSLKYLTSTATNNPNSHSTLAVEPTLTTAAITVYGTSTATMGGNVTSAGGDVITETGVVYSITDNNPTIGESDVIKDINGSTTTGPFSKSIGSLADGTTYYVQAYAINSIGTSYGGVESFTTLACTNPTSGGTISSDQTICSGDTPDAFTSDADPSGESGTLEYKWQSSTIDATSGFADIASSYSSTYSPETPTTTTWYKRLARVDCKTDWSGATESNVIKITVNNLPLAPTAGYNSYTYDGTSKTAVANVGAGETVDWYSAATGGTSVSAPSATDAGTYSAYAEARNTTTGCVSATRTLITLTIAKATLTVTATSQTKVYGDPNPALTFTYSGWKNGEGESVLETKPTANTTVSQASAFGTYINDITVSGGADNNYDFSYVPADFSVTKAMLTVTADVQTKVYGEINPILTFSYSGWKNGEDESVLNTKPIANTTVNQASAFGTYTDAITISGGADNNYSFSYVPADFTVTKATLTVTADPQTKVYGSANPSLTLRYSGWQNSDDETVLDTKPAANTSVDQASAFGTYTDAITVSGGVDNNYSFSYVPADFTVTKAILTVTADPKSKIYGAPNPPLTFLYSGWVLGQDESVLDTKPTISTTVTVDSEPGVYSNAITVSGGVADNYQFTYVPADFTVGQSDQSISFDDLSPVNYGDIPFELIASASSGLPVTFTSSDPAVVSISGNTATIVGAGTVVITASQPGNDNFKPAENISRELLVNKRTVFVSEAVAQSKVYDGNKDAVITGAVLMGARYSDHIVLENSTSGKFVQATAGTSIRVVTQMTISGDRAKNYILSQPNLRADILRKNISVTAQNVTADCNRKNQRLSYTYEPELVNGDSFSGSLTREAGETPGVYQISQGTLALSDNYAIEFTGATYTIVDNAPFWVTNSGALDRTVEYSNPAGLAGAQALQPVAFDACDNQNITPVKKSGEFVPNPECDQTGTYINTWTVQDSQGNQGEVFTQVINVVDRTPPFVQSFPSVEVTIDPGKCETKVPYPDFNVSDACLDTIELVSGLGKDGLFPIGTTMEKWKAIDKSGNFSYIYMPVTVREVNRPPMIDPIADVSVLKNAGQVEISLSGIDPVSGCATQEIDSITATADNNSLIPEVRVDYNKGDSTGKLIAEIAADVIGESTVTVWLKDNGGTANGGKNTKTVIFRITVESPTGVENLNKSFDARLYPNPSSGQVTIEISGNKKSSVTVFNSIGAQVLKKANVTAPQLKLDLSDKLPGMYFVEISSGNRTIVKKLTLKK